MNSHFTTGHKTSRNWSKPRKWCTFLFNLKTDYTARCRLFVTLPKIKSSFLYAAPQIHDPRDLLPTEPIPQNLSNEAITEHSNETKIEANTTESITGDPNAGEPQVEQVQVAYIHDPNGANGQNTENTGWTVNDAFLVPEL